MSECVTDHRQRLARESQLPSHQHHQRKAEEQKDQTAETVLNADHLVIGRENICSPPTELMILVGGGVMVRIVKRFERSGSVHFRIKLSFQYPEPNRACKARNSEKFESENVDLDYDDGACWRRASRSSSRSIIRSRLPPINR